MSKVLSSNVLKRVTEKGLVRTYDNYFSNEPVEAFKEASSRLRKSKSRPINASVGEREIESKE
ncbi:MULTISPECIES: hypothetical protein [Enterobacteriaceae]|uniref:hypothetical protein n=1 Tax=Enterobacteriaceae TaxID=543 RepID=UPI0013B3D9C8|nr:MULTISPECIES: hypothetical protein [Enterobacteriaceae]EBC4430778.1 hypothetical protein [Salmonella enterica]EKY3205097.1 hypothetical protein [Cronobacter dublinensis]MDH6634160.1 hypothetical protein [Lelliottia amnigena]HAS1962063.1 hypothetical protein [Enterobacter cloacae]HDX4061978.1 hypothetical protein [Citrobacter freundii]HDX8791765.1 hypothetical protein [Klebsiella michiganensis]